MSLLGALVDARETLLALTDRVYLPGQPWPDDDRLIIVLQPVSTVDRAHYRSAAALNRIQVTVWAADLDTVLPMSEQVREYLLPLRFIPDGGGMLTDPETHQVGWRADFRRQ